jgi:hypothetical protein
MDVTIIEIRWTGPYKRDQIINLRSDQDYGIYQIYGTHNVNGPNTLLYIGKANDQQFATRINQHYWTEWEYSELEIYIGRLGGSKQIDQDEWEKQINIAEQLLIYYCSPPYNSKNIQGYDGSIKNILVVNLDKKNRLPMEVSTFYTDSEFWNGNWEEYKIL